MPVISALPAGFLLHRHVGARHPVTRPGSGVKVKFSSKNEQSLYFAQLLAAIPQTRTEKIAQLRRSVESGTYSVDAEQVAKKMLQEAFVKILTQGILPRSGPPWTITNVRDRRGC
jgi:flagellar biosynthesis anti-sigma factor FlgM